MVSRLRLDVLSPDPHPCNTLSVSTGHLFCKSGASDELEDWDSVSHNSLLVGFEGGRSPPLRSRS